MSSSDVCVIGGGIVGLAAAASLLDRGLDVTCLERGEPGDGQSAGRTRQFRHLHREAELIELAVRARELWLGWEERFGRSLLGTEGALRAGAEPFELDALRAAGVPAVELEPDDAREAFPIAGELTGMLLFDPLAGAIRAAAAIAALAGRIGDRLHPAEAHEISVQPGGDSVEVHTDAGVHCAARCVVCAGAGTDRLVRPLGLAVHQERQAHLRLTFRTTVPLDKPLPCFSDRRGASSDIVYALSDLDDRYAVGLAAVDEYPAVDDLASDLPAGVDVSSQRERIIAYAARALPGLDPDPIGDVFRLTTTVPEHPEDGFGIWRGGPVIALAGPNLFKFAPVLGERLADEATDAALRTARGTPVAPSL